MAEFTLDPGSLTINYHPVIGVGHLSEIRPLAADSLATGAPAIGAGPYGTNTLAAAGLTIAQVGVPVGYFNVVHDLVGDGITATPPILFTPTWWATHTLDAINLLINPPHVPGASFGQAHAFVGGELAADTPIIGAGRWNLVDLLAANLAVSGLAIGPAVFYKTFPPTIVDSAEIIYKRDLDETTAALHLILRQLRAIGPRTIGRDGADLRAALGALYSNARIAIEDGEVGADLGECFELARKAGATYSGMARVRAVAEAQAPRSLSCAAVLVAAIRMSLVEESLILAATEFKSRDEIDKIFAYLVPAFDRAIEYAGDCRETQVMRGLIGLFGAVSADLNGRARPLPRMVSIEFPQSMSLLWLANRVYGDGSRADELYRENNPVHPAFMPNTIKALSA